VSEVLEKTCQHCNKPFLAEGAQRYRKIFCSTDCKFQALNERRVIEKTCPKCKQPFRGVKTGVPECKSCRQEGEKSHTWLGGHKYWQEGKLGRDPQGLSWKVQRQLAWDRDNYTCQEPDCGKTMAETGRKPDVDHVRPYRISQSHALDNLLCRCKSCHKKAEAKRTELWGGKPFGGSAGRPKKPSCDGCHKPRRKIFKEGKCEPCYKELVLIPKVLELRAQGQTFVLIGFNLGIPHQRASEYVRSHASNTGV
jgi:5-methylcytosine-specific restriction endonuclease McrA